MSTPASANLLSSIAHHESEILSMLSSNRPFLNDCVGFLFQKDRQMQTLFVMDGMFGMFIAGAASHSGIENLIVKDGLMGPIDANFGKVVMISCLMTDGDNPVNLWRDICRSLFPHKEGRCAMEIRCLIDDRAEGSSKSSDSIENMEVVSVKSLI